ncbi:MAG TPA: LysM peptidoglycan-binding domain-containing protein, partial [Flavobacteriaceae bacterium]|nr:LysM peptidoglycan-binding domain-containing protein [Flavobacteriaceae bacterium]
YDINDLCPNLPGNIENKGCPNSMSEKDNIELVKLTKNIYFESGEYFLRESSKRQLEKVYEIMENNPGLKFIIEGHTDSGGKHDYNMKLSQNRVNEVKSYLILLGIDSNRLRSIGYGFTRPKYTNINSQGRQLNRRVEISVDDNSLKEIINTQTHIVKKEDTLLSIAQKYNITVEQLKLWNSLDSNNITIGSKLIIKKQ